MERQEKKQEQKKLVTKRSWLSTQTFFHFFFQMKIFHFGHSGHTSGTKPSFFVPLTPTVTSTDRRSINKGAVDVACWSITSSRPFLRIDIALLPHKTSMLLNIPQRGHSAGLRLQRSVAATLWVLLISRIFSQNCKCSATIKSSTKTTKQTPLWYSCVKPPLIKPISCLGLSVFPNLPVHELHCTPGTLNWKVRKCYLRMFLFCLSACTDSGYVPELCFSHRSEHW